MKLILDKNHFSENIAQFLRNAGYLNIYDKRTSKESYVRSLARGNYPRFHLYVKDNEVIILDLHLDHKQASYAGNHMHNAEYEGDLVEAEIARLAAMAGPAVIPANAPVETSVKKEAVKLPPAYEPKTAANVKTKFSGHSHVIGHGSLDEHLSNPPLMPAKKPWWKIF